MTLGTFCIGGKPHTIERKPYGREGKEFMSFRLGENMRLKTFSTTVMEIVESCGEVWVSGEITETQGGPGYEEKYYTNYDAKVAWLKAPAKVKAPAKQETQAENNPQDLPF